jgi:alkylation response protein AidB-like acyl-CoA dehydrogenase
MDVLFSFEELEVKKVVKRFVKTDLLPIRIEVDRLKMLPPATWKTFRSMGLLRAAFPEAYGGSDCSFTALIIAMKELSYATLVPSWILFENFILCYAIYEYGSDFLRECVLPKLISLEKIGALAFTEPDTGSDPGQLKTTARRREADHGWKISGYKRFITNSSTCDYMVLFARTGEGITAFLIDSKREGYNPQKRESFVYTGGLDNGDVAFEDYFAPEDHVIGQENQGFEILLNTEAMGKIAFSSLFVGQAERALHLAVEYSKTRSHRGRSIGEKFQMTQFKIAEMAAKVMAMEAFLYAVSRKADKGESIHVDSAALKLFVAEGVCAVTSRAMEVHGAYGLSNEYEISDLYKSSISAQAVMGNTDIQRVIVARSFIRGNHGKSG